MYYVFPLRENTLYWKRNIVAINNKMQLVGASLHQPTDATWCGRQLLSHMNVCDVHRADDMQIKLLVWKVQHLVL